MNNGSHGLRSLRRGRGGAVRAKIGGAGVAVGAATLACVPAFANDGAAAVVDQPDEIVVTGQRLNDPYSEPGADYKVNRSASSKLTQPLEDTPRSVTVIPREVIEDIGALSVRDVVRTQPGITLGTGEGGNAFGDRVFIRGFEARNDVYIDGQRDPGVVSREVFAVEQIEVLKGPSSTIGGRGTTGGAISLVSKAPGDARFARGEATIGTDETVRLTADVNTPLARGVSLRVNGLFHDSKVAGRDRVNDRRWGVATALLLEPTDAIDVKLDYYHLTTDGLPDWGIPFDPRTRRPFAGIRSNFYGLVQRDFIATRTDVATLKVTADVSDAVTLNSQTRFGRTRNSYIATAPERPVVTGTDPALFTVRANPKNRNAVTKYIANLSDATARFDSGGIGHTLVAGFEVSREQITNRPFAFAQSETVGAPVVPAIVILQPILNPDPDQNWPLARTLSGASTRAEVDTAAAYLIDTLALSPQLDLTLGVRYDSYRLDVVGTSTAGVRTPLEQNDGFSNWNAGLAWKPTEALTLYAAASTSSNPSGEQIDGNGVSYGGLGSQTVNLDPERNRSYEVGVKWTPNDGDLLLTAAAFRIDKTNARVNAPGGTVQVLGGEQRSQGIELGVAGSLTDRIALFGGYTLIDAEVRESPNPAEVGGRFPNVPKHSFSMLAMFEVVEGVQVGGQAFYASKRFGGSNVAGEAMLPGYWRFDATARWQATPGLEFRLNALNLANTTYYDAIYRSGTPFAYVAPGRSVLASAAFTF